MSVPWGQNRDSLNVQPIAKLPVRGGDGRVASDREAEDRVVSAPGGGHSGKALGEPAGGGGVGGSPGDELVEFPEDRIRNDRRRSRSGSLDLRFERESRPDR